MSLNHRYKCEPAPRKAAAAVSDGWASRRHAISTREAMADAVTGVCVSLSAAAASLNALGGMITMAMIAAVSMIGAETIIFAFALLYETTPASREGQWRGA